jgi:spore maturation protein B
MNVFFACIIPCIFLFTFLYALRKKIKIYDAFTDGAKGAIPLITSIFPYIASVMILSELFTVSGLEEKTLDLLSPTFQTLGIPKEIAPLLLMKPLSGNGSIAVLSDILTTYGADGYIARCACVAYGSSETAFYIGAVYFADLKRKNLPVALLISLFSFLAAVVFGCFLCKFM